jgi:hypothetical protein
MERIINESEIRNVSEIRPLTDQELDSVTGGKASTFLILLAICPAVALGYGIGWAASP